MVFVLEMCSRIFCMWKVSSFVFHQPVKSSPKNLLATWAMQQTPFPSLSLSHHTILHVQCPGKTAPRQYKCFQRFFIFFQTLNIRPTAAFLGELTHPSWLLFCTGITPSSSSRTRTPASINATPANINLAGQCRPFLVELGYKVLQALLCLTQWSFLQT